MSRDQEDNIIRVGCVVLALAVVAVLAVFKHI